MKAHFLFNFSETIDGWLKFGMDWECLHLPRMGETIEPSIIMKGITPNMFREAMTEKSGAEWDKQIAEDHHEAELMKNWLIEMKMKVVDVSWGMSYGEHYVSFLMEESNRNKHQIPKHPLRDLMFRKVRFTKILEQVLYI